ncbi:hypothetical protein EYF80_053384 [Liparis tanakae]|uniref:Uncharacterized protein n=1 Tax=Liparis tanakae TaxID=230148 RepID=A0A4Z2F816_9TELE|nr:hypothetical protein EYF80_053384 [Liparis tanakae]
MSLQHLRGAVLQRATEIVEELPGRHRDGGAEVDESDVETFVDDDVLVLDVPVEDVLRPQVEDGGHQLGETGQTVQRKASGVGRRSAAGRLAAGRRHLPPRRRPPHTHLAEDVAGQRLVQPGLQVDELKQLLASTPTSASRSEPTTQGEGVRSSSSVSQDVMDRSSSSRSASARVTAPPSPLMSRKQLAESTTRAERDASAGLGSEPPWPADCSQKPEDDLGNGGDDLKAGVLEGGATQAAGSASVRRGATRPDNSTAMLSGACLEESLSAVRPVQLGGAERRPGRLLQQLGRVVSPEGKEASNTRVEVTAGGERVDRALPGFSSRVSVPVKIRPLPVEVLPRTACCTMAMSPATREDGSEGQTVQSTNQTNRTASRGQKEQEHMERRNGGAAVAQRDTSAVSTTGA